MKSSRGMAMKSSGVMLGRRQAFGSLTERLQRPTEQSQHLFEHVCLSSEQEERRRLADKMRMERHRNGNLCLIARAREQKRSAQLWYAHQQRAATSVQTRVRGMQTRSILARGSTPEAEARARAEAKARAAFEAQVAADRAHTEMTMDQASAANEARATGARVAVAVVWLQLDAAGKFVQDATVQVQHLSVACVGRAPLSGAGACAEHPEPNCPDVIVLLSSSCRGRQG